MLNNRIIDARKYAKLTQTEFSKALNIGKRTLADYEKGTSEPKVSLITLVAKICNIDSYWLLTGKGNMHLEEPTSTTTASNNSIAVSGTVQGNINLNTSDFNHSEDIRDIVELLQYAPSAFLTTIKTKLEKFKELSTF